MDNGSKGTLQTLTERLTAWFNQIGGKQGPGGKAMADTLDSYLAKGVAAVNDMLSRLRGKK